jgi:predicted dehydrogenase
MRLGILGTDRWAASVAAAAVARGDSLVHEIDDGTTRGWERFLDAATCDMVVVGNGLWSPARAEAVRTLVQMGRPLVVSQPLELSMLWAWEIEMIRQDAHGTVIPILPARLHPYSARLRFVIEAAVGGTGSLGAIESVVLERKLPDRRREHVLASLARDADLVRAILGEPSRLSAFGAAADDAVWNSLTVGFSGPALVPARWQVASAAEDTLAITIRGDRDSIVVTMPDDDARPWQWSGLDQLEPASPHDAGRAILHVLDAALGNPRVIEREENGVPPATWADAARAIELAESVPRSVAKGRAIDLHREEFTELGTFRGTMASLGCGIILAALVLVVAAAVVGGIANEVGWDLGARIAGAWPIVALVVLGGFLLLQLLPMLVTTDRRHD